QGRRRPERHSFGGALRRLAKAFEERLIMRGTRSMDNKVSLTRRDALAFAGAAFVGGLAPAWAQRGTGAGAALAPISVSGSYWIELSPVLVAAASFYPEKLDVGEGGITRITSG